MPYKSPDSGTKWSQERCIMRKAPDFLTRTMTSVRLYFKKTATKLTRNKAKARKSETRARGWLCQGQKLASNLQR